MLKPVKHRKEIIVFVVIIAVSLFALSVQIRKKEKMDIFSNLMDIVAYPIRHGIRYSVDAVTGEWNTYINLINVRGENEKLRKQIAEYEGTINALKEYDAENKRLKKMLNFKESFDGEVIPARVIGKDFSSWFHTITLDKGTDDGIIKRLAVVTPMGIVGKVVESSKYTSRVLLVTDHNSGVAALVQESRIQGIVSGNSGNMCKLKFVGKTSNIEKGNLLISSGLGSIFPKGLMLGRVVNITENKSELFQDITVKPAVDFSRLEEVLVMKNIRESKKH